MLADAHVGFWAWIDAAWRLSTHDTAAVIGTVAVAAGTVIQVISDVSYKRIIRAGRSIVRQAQADHPGRRRRDRRARNRQVREMWAAAKRADPGLALEYRQSDWTGYAWICLMLGSFCLVWDALGRLPGYAQIPWALVIAVALGLVGRSANRVAEAALAADSQRNGPDAPAPNGSSPVGSSPVTSEAHAGGGDVQASVGVLRGSACASASVTVDEVTASAEARVGPEATPPAPPAADA